MHPFDYGQRNMDVSYGEGEDWVRLDHLKPSSKPVHGIRFADGSEWDSYNGWRFGPRRTVKDEGPETTGSITWVDKPDVTTSKDKAIFLAAENLRSAYMQYESAIDQMMRVIKNVR